MPMVNTPVLSRIKKAAFSCMTGLGLPRMLHRIALHDRLTILMYHAVVRSPLPVKDWCFLPEDAFQEQMTYLRKHFEVVSLREAARRLRYGTLRRPTAAITFDDGFQNNYDVAFPILKRAGLPATIFLVTDLVGTDDTIWFCRLHEAFIKTRTTRLDWRGRGYEFSTPEMKTRASADLQDCLKELASPVFSRELAGLFRALDYDPSVAIEAGSPFRILSIAAIRDMAASGLIEFGAHTRSHMILSQLTEAEADGEIRGSVAGVAELTGRPCRLFSYPNGRPCDFSRRAVETLEQSGVWTAVTTTGGGNDSRTPPLELKRYRIGCETSCERFQLLAHHFLHHR